MDSDFGTLFIVLLLCLAPAVVVFIVLTVMQARRGKFRRQRITKKSSKPKE